MSMVTSFSILRALSAKIRIAMAGGRTSAWERNAFSTTIYLSEFASHSFSLQRAAGVVLREQFILAPEHVNTPVVLVPQHITAVPVLLEDNPLRKL